MQILSAHFISVELTDILAALVSTGRSSCCCACWQPAEPRSRRSGRRRSPARPPADPRSRPPYTPRPRQDFRARSPSLAPYLIIIAVFTLAQLGPIKDALAHGVEGVRLAGAGRRQPGRRAGVDRHVQVQLAADRRHADVHLRRADDARAAHPAARWRCARSAPRCASSRPAIVTVMAVLALAYVMNQSGQTTSLGRWLAGAGGAFAFLARSSAGSASRSRGPTRSSNALFGTLQVAAAKDADLARCCWPPPTRAAACWAR